VVGGVRTRQEIRKKRLAAEPVFDYGIRLVLATRRVEIESGRVVRNGAARNRSGRQGRAASGFLGAFCQYWPITHTSHRRESDEGEERSVSKGFIRTQM
jgi:hypothetical protein